MIKPIRSGRIAMSRSVERLSTILGALCVAGCASGASSAEAPPEVTFGNRVRLMPIRDRIDVDAKLDAFSASSLPAGTHLTYQGGKVIQDVNVFKVLYGSGIYIPELTSTSGVNVASAYNQMVTSGIFDWLSEYNTISPEQTINRGSFGGSFQITPAAAHNGSTITDASIQAELVAQINAGALPTPNDNAMYMVHFPSGKSITSPDGGSSCVAGGFCAYHGTFKLGAQNVYYGVLPALTGGCATSCGTATTTFNNQTSVASHELIEAVTDPEVGLTPLTQLTGPPLGWVNPPPSSGSFAGFEIGDICNAQQGAFSGSDGASYTIQQEFSNQQNGCITTRFLPPPSLGAQTVVAQVGAAQGWTSVVPMDLNNDGLTDLLSYNATTGLAVYSVGTTTPGQQVVVAQVNAAPGWTSIVPMNLNNDGLTDLLSYNATTGLAVYSVATTTPGQQTTVEQVNAAPGWTTIVPMNMNRDGLTDLLSYNATTGLAVYSIATTPPGPQTVVAQVNAAPGWTSVVPMNMNRDGLTDLLSYNATTGLAVYSTATTTPGSQTIVTRVNAAPGWTSVVPMAMNRDGLTDLLSYNATTGLAAYSVAAVLGQSPERRAASSDATRLGCSLWECRASCNGVSGVGLGDSVFQGQACAEARTDCVHQCSGTCAIEGPAFCTE